MSGKSPTSVITDGDLAMKNAIRRVFPKCHHKLCAWHLIRNALTNVNNNKYIIEKLSNDYPCVIVPLCLKMYDSAQ